ncbi:transporter substrate-binding domain-containing protein [Desulfobotulus sp. H1]|uniref:Transporter substrate-binding domain-containing protein n=1 Tax=Desulfobotulus pelophilus TaxID=2823377 RepID=A0ABT3N6P6_9BACT|nr:transporter substrate-binding domain-containing protein [Desulfobotulus pelophilus]MCW7753119.1 transporter substrate-binding domain-containing protein [Desulfobotulus pelophilus]
MQKIWVVALMLALAAGTGNARSVIRMGYAPEGHIPIISEAPDNSGLYQDVFLAAAEKIGYGLEITRMPKRRILNLVESGELDFYPGFSYTAARAQWAFYFKNGLVESNAAVTLAAEPEITDREEINARGYVVLVPLGGEYGKEFTLYYEFPRLSVEKAMEMLQTTPKRGDVFVYRKSSLAYYLKRNPAEAPLFRIHSRPWSHESMYLGFSKNSPLAEFEVNLDFDPSLPESETNQPERLLPSCVAAQFMTAIDEMGNNGEIDALYIRYYGKTRDGTDLD